MSVQAAYDRIFPSLEGYISRDEKLAPYMAFGIGGKADLLIECRSVSDLNLVFPVLEQEGIEWVCIGKGSNMLASDAGFRGAVVVLGGEFARIQLDEEGCRLLAGAAVPLSTAVITAYKADMSGLEFAAGIPGTLGGAIAGNVGTGDEWISSKVASLTVYSTKGGLENMRGEEIPWRYRRCGLSSDVVILEAQITLKPAKHDVLRSRLEGNRTRRRRTQPVGKHCAGNIFKNAEGWSAGKLMEQAGCKGLHIGDAEISKKHANFIVNRGRATAQDVVDLIVLAQSRVKEAYGIELVPKIRFLGFE